MKNLLTLLALAFCLHTNAQIITTVAGNGTTGVYPCSLCYGGDGGSATAAEIYDPSGVAFDAAGNLYIADAGNNRIRKVTTAGIISTFAGTGAPGFSGDGGPATAAKLWEPMSVSIDAIGNMYIADNANFVIRKVTTAGIISTIAGDTTQGYSGDGGPATAAALNQPSYACADAAGNVFIADEFNSVIRKVNTAGIISTFAGDTTQGYSGDGGPATAAQLSYASGIALDVAGNFYIADNANNRIRKVNTSGIITTIAGNGTLGYSGDGGPATAAELSAPTFITTDNAGNVYFTDGNNNRLRMINTAGIISTIAGNGLMGYGGDGGPATAAKLNTPQGITIDAAGNLYIADWSNNRVRKVYNCSSSTNFPTVNYTLTADATPHIWDIYPVYSSNVSNARWNWGDGTDTLALYPSHTYSVAGWYNICVTAYSVCGDSAQSCQNDTVYRLANNSTLSSMVYVSVKNSAMGIKQIANNNEQVNIYPNPNNGTFTIKTNNSAEQILQIFDVNGRLVLTETITGNTTINANDLINGVYNIKISSSEGVANKRLIIAR